MKHKFSIVILLTAFSAFVSAGIDEPIPNLQQPKYMIFTAGQPTSVGFDQIAAMGVKTVINVLPERECLEGEDIVVASNHMEYQQLPFDPAGLSMETLGKFAELLSRAEKPVLIHCSTGNHVGGLWFAYRVLMNNASLPQALKEARKIGMKPAMEDMVFRWITEQKTQQT